MLWWLSWSDWLESYELTVFKEAHVFLFTLIRTCADESKLCKGVALCPNKEDVKFCKNATSWTLDYSEWKPTDGRFLSEHTDVSKQFIFLKVKIKIYVTGNCLEIENVSKF